MIRAMWLNADPDEFLRRYKANSSQFPITAISGAPEALTKLSKRGYRLALLTSITRTMLETNLSQIGIDQPSLLTFRLRKTRLHINRVPKFRAFNYVGIAPGL